MWAEYVSKIRLGQIAYSKLGLDRNCRFWADYTLKSRLGHIAYSKSGLDRN